MEDKLYNIHAPRVVVVNDEDFRGNILFDSLGLDTLNAKLKKSVGEYTVNVKKMVPNDKGKLVKCETTEMRPNMEIFPTSDPDELSNRLGIFDFLRTHRNYKFTKPDRYTTFGYLNIPASNQSFFSKYLRETPDFDEYKVFVKMKKDMRNASPSNSPRLEKFRSELDRVDEMLELENGIRSDIFDVASKTGEYVGIVDVKLSTIADGNHAHDLKITCKNNMGVGITHISNLFEVKEFDLPQIVKKITPDWFSASIINSRNDKIQNKFYKDKLVKLSNYGKVNNFIEKIINNLILENNGHRMDKLVHDKFTENAKNPLFTGWVNTNKSHTRGSGEANLENLVRRPINFSIQYHIYPSAIKLTFNGFPQMDVNESDYLADTYGRSMSNETVREFEKCKAQVMSVSKAYLGEIEHGVMNLFGVGQSYAEHVRSIQIEDSEMSGEIFTQYLPKLVDYSPISDKLEIITAWKKYMFENLKFLNGYIHIHNHFRGYYDTYKLVLPELDISGKKTLQFSNILPIHLRDEKNSSTGTYHTLDNLKAITSLDSHGANLVVLTGQNAGGKSVALETIVNTIWLAHCGVPIFGDNLKFNIRSHIGLCFLSRGTGSTMQLQSKKIANILREFRDAYDPDACLGVIDELGTGTTENNMYDPSGGYGFGLKVLNASSSYDMVVSTQITELANFTDENMDAVTYMFDDNHNISMGIGKPNLTKLIKETGLDEFIN